MEVCQSSYAILHCDLACDFRRAGGIGRAEYQADACMSDDINHDESCPTTTAPHRLYDQSCAHHLSEQQAMLRFVRVEQRAP